MVAVRKSSEIAEFFAAGGAMAIKIENKDACKRTNHTS
jgi:hypothetical protein